MWVVFVEGVHRPKIKYIAGRSQEGEAGQQCPDRDPCPYLPLCPSLSRSPSLLLRNPCGQSRVNTQEGRGACIPGTVAAPIEAVHPRESIGVLEPLMHLVHAVSGGESLVGVEGGGRERCSLEPGQHCTVEDEK